MNHKRGLIKVRVLVLSHMYPGVANPISGIFVQQQVREMVQFGVETQVISPRPWSPRVLHFHPRWRRYGQIPAYSLEEAPQVFRPAMPIIPGLGIFHPLSPHVYWLASRNVLDSLVPQVDIIQAHVAFPDGLVGLWLKHFFHKPLVVTVHGYDIARTIRRIPQRQQILKVFLGADRTIFVSSKLRDIARLYLPTEKTQRFEVIGNGVQVISNNGFKNIPHPRKFLLSVGNLIAQKGHSDTILAFSKIYDNFPEIDLLIVGEGPERKNLERLIRSLELQQRVYLLGQFPHTEVLTLMRESLLFVLPSWNEGFGIVYLEAMSQGKTVIGCQGEGLSDFVTNGQTGYLVPAHDVIALANHITNLVKDPVCLARVGEAARREAEKHTWRVNAEAYYKLYEDLLGVKETL